MKKKRMLSPRTSPHLLAGLAVLVVVAESLHAGDTGNPAKGGDWDVTVCHYFPKIKAMLPDGWSVTAEKDVITVRRDENVEATYASPVGIMPEDISTADVFQIRVGPRISAELYARMAAENMKVREELRAKNPNYDPVERPIASQLPHVLPTHFDQQHSLWISSKLLNRGFIEFKSTEVFDECARVYAGVKGLFHDYDDRERPEQSSLLKGVIALRDTEELAETIRQQLPANWRVVTQRIVDWSAGGAANWPRGRGVEMVIERQGFQPSDLKFGRGGQVVLAVLERGHTPPDPEIAREAQAGNAQYLGPWRYPGIFGMVFGGNDWPTAKADIQAAMKTSQPSQPPSAGSIRVSEVQGFATRLSGIMPANWEVASLEHRETGGPGWPKGDAVVIGLQRKGITAAEREDRRGGTLTLAVMLGEFTLVEPVGDAQVMAARPWGACQGHAVFAVFGDPQDWPNMEQDVRGLLEVASPPTKGSGSDKPTAAKPLAGGAVAWGESANGLQARLKLKSTSQQPRPSAVLVLHVRNAGDEPIRMLKLSAQARFWGECLPLEIRSSGAILEYQGPLLEPPAPPDESEYITLNPGDVDSTEVTLVPEHWKLAVPVEAQAVFVYKQTLREVKTVGPYDHDKQQWKIVGGLWTGEARSQAVSVKMSHEEWSRK